jgi:hypothetical protein
MTDEVKDMYKMYFIGLFTGGMVGIMIGGVM